MINNQSTNTPDLLSPLVWDRRIRKVADLGEGVTVWTVALHKFKDPNNLDYTVVRNGEALAVFVGQKLESAATDYNNRLSSFVYHDIMRNAKMFAANLKEGRLPYAFRPRGRRP